MSLNSKIRQRLQWAEEGDWLNLVGDLIDAEVRPGGRQRGEQTDDKTVQRMLKLAAEGSWRRLIAALRAPPQPDHTQAGWDKLKRELPEDVHLCPVDESLLQLSPEEVEKLRALLARKAKGSDDAAAAGLLGPSPWSWKLLVRGGADHAEVAISLLQRIALGAAPVEVEKVLLHADL